VSAESGDARLPHAAPNRGAVFDRERGLASTNIAAARECGASSLAGSARGGDVSDLELDMQPRRGPLA
jgi:hypothetical protein